MNDDVAIKNYKEKTLCDSCLYNPHYLIIQKKIVSQLIAFFLLFAFFIFALGYFLGKKKLAEDFSHIVDQTNFSDQINFALTSLYERENAQMNQNQKEFELSTEPEQLAQNPSNNVVSLPSSNPSSAQGSPMSYTGKVFGGTQKAVNFFAQNLAKKGIQVEVRAIPGKTQSGKSMVWYQAVTKPYTNKTEYDAVIAMIKKIGRIKDSDITTVQVPA